jgi:hypothetical protein
MITYTFREDGPLAIKNAAKADPQKMGEALARVADGNEGRLTPNAVVESARNSRHALHKHFEWDNTIAAGRYREDQARAIIRVVMVADGDTEEGVARAFISVADKGGVAYHSHAEVKSSLQLQVAVLDAAERDLKAFQRRYRELGDVCDSVRVAEERIKAEREKVEPRVQ